MPAALSWHIAVTEGKGLKMPVWYGRVSGLKWSKDWNSVNREETISSPSFHLCCYWLHTSFLTPALHTSGPAVVWFNSRMAETYLICHCVFFRWFFLAILANGAGRQKELWQLPAPACWWEGGEGRWTHTRPWQQRAIVQLPVLLKLCSFNQNVKNTCNTLKWMVLS